MISVHSFTFNPFSENTYILFDETQECIIIDPGCYTQEEKEELVQFIEKEKLKPVRVVLTHAHIDHMLGNNFVCGKYSIYVEINKVEVAILQAAPIYGEMWGIKAEPSPEAHIFLKEKDTITFGNTRLDIIETPGHSPGSLCFINDEKRFVIGGDVLFNESIGRTDLPGGDYNTLIESIRMKLFNLPDDFIVYPGHGSSTTIGHEKEFNPFVGANALQKF